VGMGGCMGEG
jgi:hypothetical protein